MNVPKRIEGMFLTAFLLLTGLLLAVCFTGTFHHISLWNMLIVTAGMFGCLGVLILLLTKAIPLLKKIDNRHIWLLLIVYGMALYGFGCRFRNVPSADYAMIYQEVEHYVRGEDIAWWYFAHWENNLPLFYVLCAVAKLGSWLGIQDIFYSLYFMNTVGAVISGYGVYWLIGHFYPGQVMNRWLGLLLYMGFVPLWGGQYYAYTDSVSMVCGIGAAVLFISGRRGWHYALAGAFTAAGYLLKPTSIFCIIAWLLVELVYRRKSFPRKRFLLFLAVIALVVGGYRLSADSLPHSSLREQYAVPFAYWPAVGLLGNGSYWQNQEFASRCANAPEYEQRKELAMKVIRENYANLWDWQHIKDKMRLNFANGNFGLSDYQRTEDVGLYELLNEYGTYGGYTTMVTTAYYYMMLILMWFSALRLLWRREGEEQPLLLMVFLDWFGIVCFLMLWEANNRQLYNQMPWLAIGAASSVACLWPVKRNRDTRKQSGRIDEIHGSGIR